MLIEETIRKKTKKISKWKKKHGDIYIIGISDKDNEIEQAFIFRTLGREEYKFLFMNYMDDIAKFQELVCETAALYPKKQDYANGLAGIPETLSNMILEVSGFAEGQALNLLAKFREQMFEYDFQVDCMIHEAFPEINIEEIQMWNNYKTMYYLSRAEFILEGIRGQPIRTIEDIIAEAEQLQEEMQEVAQQESEQQEYDQTFVATPMDEMPPEIREQFEQMEQEPNPMQQAAPPPSVKEGGIGSEAEIMAMLGQNENAQGRNVSNPQGGQGIGGSKMFPELSWFQAEDDLKGGLD